MSAVRALRGATTVDADTPDQVSSRMQELLSDLLARNGLEHDDVISIVFTATGDVVSMFPAAAARAMGLGDVPLLCARELDVVGATPAACASCSTSTRTGPAPSSTTSTCTGPGGCAMTSPSDPRRAAVVGTGPDRRLDRARPAGAGLVGHRPRRRPAAARPGPGPRRHRRGGGRPRGRDHLRRHPARGRWWPRSTLVAPGAATRRGRDRRRRGQGAARGRAPRSPGFVGGHPMAGSEQVGIDGADPDLFVGATWVLTPTATTDPDAYARLQSVVTSLGAEVLALPPSSTTRLVAMVSHVPHLTAATLMNLADRAAEEHGALLRLAAGGFRDMTRIAAGQPGIWPDVCAENAPPSSPPSTPCSPTCRACATGWPPPTGPGLLAELEHAADGAAIAAGPRRGTRAPGRVAGAGPGPTRRAGRDHHAGRRPRRQHPSTSSSPTASRVTAACSCSWWTATSPSASTTPSPGAATARRRGHLQ